MPFQNDPYTSIFDSIDREQEAREQSQLHKQSVIQQAALANRAPQGQSKAQSLIDRQLQKLEGFDARAGLSENDLTDSFRKSVGKQGQVWNDSDANKIHNEYSADEVDHIIKRANEEFGLHRSASGTYFDRQEGGGFGIDETTGLVVPMADGPLGVFKGDLSQYNTLYRYGTLDGNQKWGLSYGDDPSVRYSDEYLKRTGSYIGPKGVNRDDLQASYLLPQNLTRLLEGTIHGSEGYKNLRLYREDYNDRARYQQDKADFGSGVTEAYRTRTPSDQPINEEVWTAWRERFNPDGQAMFRPSTGDKVEEYYRLGQRIEAEEGLGVGGRLANALGTLGSNIVNEVAIAPAQWLGESTGWWDMGSTEETTQMVNDWFRVNPYVLENVTNDVKETATAIMKEYSETGDINYGLIAQGLYQGLQGAPELLGASVGFVLSLYLPAGAIGKVQKGNRLRKSMDKIDEAVKVGRITTETAKAQRAAATAVAQTASRMEKFVAHGVPFGVLTGNQLARDVEAFRKNNDGEVTAADILRMAPISALQVGIDTQASAFMLRDFVKLSRLSKLFAKDAAKEVAKATPQQYGTLVRSFLGTVKAASIVGGHTALEGGQEYLQAMLEIFNSQYATEKYGKDIAAILSDELNQIEGITNAMLGGSLGGAVSTAGRAKVAVTSTFGESFNKYAEKRKAGKTVQEAAAAGRVPVESLAPQEVEQAKAEFRELFTELLSLREEPLTEENFLQKFADYRRMLYLRDSAGHSREEAEALDRHIEAFDKVFLNAANELNIGDLNMENIREREVPSETAETVQAALAQMFPNIDPDVIAERVRVMSQAEIEAELGMTIEQLMEQEDGKASIAGPRATTANAGLLDSAKALRDAGTDAEQIWSLTGWYQAEDGNWRFEINDNEATTTSDLNKQYEQGTVPQAAQATTLENTKLTELTGTQKLGTLLSHDKLFEAYPHLEDIDVKVQRPAPGVKAQGLVDLANGVMLVEANTLAEARSIILHETQHAVQRHENVDSGANLRTPLAGENRQGFTAEDVYQRSLGEIEARNTQFRADEMHPKYAKTAPWQTADQFSEIAVRNPDGSVTLTAGSVKGGTSSAARRTPRADSSLEGKLAVLGHRILDHAAASYAEKGKELQASEEDRNTRYSRLESLHKALKDSFYAQRHHDIKYLAKEFDLPAGVLNEWNSLIDQMNAAEKGKPVKQSPVRFSKTEERVQAITHKGTVYVIPENIPRGEAGSVILHEIGVHLAQADKRLGKHFSKFADAVRRMEKSKDEETRNIVSSAIARTEAALGERAKQANKQLWDEELVAYTVEEAVSAGRKPTAMGSPVEQFLSRVMEFFRTALTLVFKTESAKDLAEKLTIQQVVDLAHGFAQKELTKASKRSDKPTPQVKEQAPVVEETVQPDLVEEAEVTSEREVIMSDALLELEPTDAAVVEAVIDDLDDGDLAEAKASSIRRETKQTPAQRKATQEAVVRELIEFMGRHSKEGELPAAKLQELKTLGSRRSISPETVEKIVKSYASVLQESTIEEAGVRTRFANVQRLLNSGTATKSQVLKEYNELLSWLYTTESSMEQLQETIKKAENFILKHNSTVAPVPRKGEEVIKSEYRTHKDSSSKGAPFTIKITRDKETKKWGATASIKEAQKRIDEKEATRNAILGVLRYMENNGAEFLTEAEIYSEGGFRFGAASGKGAAGIRKNIAAERKYVDGMMQAIFDFTGQRKSVNKMILSDSTSDRWKPTAERTRANRGIINTRARKQEEYTSDDVVMLHSVGKWHVGGNKHRSDLYSTETEGGKELEAALEAGATIVLESTVRAVNAEGKPYHLVGYTTASKDKMHNNKRWRSQGYDAFTSQRLVEMLKGRGYVQLSETGFGASVFVPPSEALTAKQKELAEANKAKAEYAKTKAHELSKLVRAQSLVTAIRDYGYDPDGITLAEAEARLEELELSVGNAYFTKKALREEAAEQAEMAASEETEFDNKISDTAAPAPLTAEALGISEEQAKQIETADKTVVEEENLVNTIEEGEVSDNSQNNVHLYATRNVEKAVNDMVELLRGAEAEGTLFEARNKAVEHMAKLRLGRMEKATEKGTALLNVWAEASKLRPTIKELYEKLKEAGSNIYGHEQAVRIRRLFKNKVDVTPEDTILLGGIAENILREAVGAGRKIKGYSVRSYKQIGTQTKETVTWAWSKEGLTLGDQLNEKGEVVRTITQINPTELDPTKFLQVGNITPLNTVPTNELPPVFQKIIENVGEALVKRIPELKKAEAEFRRSSGHKEDRADMFYAVNSPSRGLIYRKDGTIDPAVKAAIGIALGEALKTDRKSISAGYKTTEELARMFNVRPEEVTSEMETFARQHGAFRKSLGRTLGKSALTALGIRRMPSTETDPIARGQYETLEADLGNIIIEVGESMGLFEATQAPSNELANLFEDGEVREGGDAEAVTHFVKLVEKPYEVGKERTDVEAVANMIADHAEMDKYMPNVAGRRKGPRIGKRFTKEELQRAATRVRNDQANALTPAEAQKALKSYMETPFLLDQRMATDFFERLEDPAVEASVKEFLGFIPLDESHPEYAKLLFAEKEKQIGKNRDIEASLEALRELTTLLEGVEPGEASRLYFEFFYSGNHRFNVDSNTVNMVADKLHRFFVMPEATRMTYDANRANNTFSYTYEEKGKTKTIDTSLYIRAALAQAFGQGIDKMPTREIIRIGNALLSLSNEQVKALRDQLYTMGKFDKSKVLAIRMPDAEGAVSTLDLTPDHLSHALQALDFLDDYTSGDHTQITSSITFEMDALTSGFSNKVQQFGLLNELSEHARRVGIINKDYRVNASETDPGTSIYDLMNDPTRPEYSTNDALANTELGLDSYQNLGRTTIRTLPTSVATMESRTARSMFEALSPFFPGAKDALDHNASGAAADAFNPIIDSALRNMFKPAFMIFNYAASVARIKKNLGSEIAGSMLSKIASMDLKSPDNAALIAALEGANGPSLIKNVTVSGKKITTVAELQKALRELRPKEIRISVKSEGKGRSINKPLAEYIGEDLIEPTYGVSVEQTFETEFADFIQIQNATNDMFRTAFQLFDRMLMERVKEWRADNVAAPVTESVILNAIEELTDVFPLIAGPLSESLREGVYIYETDTRTPTYVMQTQIAPQTRRLPSAKNKAESLTIHPLLRNIVSAVNSGAVLPLHALDGAQMAYMTNAVTSMVMKDILGMEGAGVTPIHDAIMSALAFVDTYAYQYNKGTVELNKGYDIMGEMVKLGERIEKVINDVVEQNEQAKQGIGKRASLDIKNIAPIRNNTTLRETRKAQKEKRESLKDRLKYLQSAKVPNTTEIAKVKTELAEVKEAGSYIAETKKLVNTLRTLHERVLEAREKVYTEGDIVGVLVGLRGGMYRVGDTRMTPDLSYLQALADDGVYQTTNVSLHASIPLKARSKSKKAQTADLILGAQDGTYKADQLQNLKADTLLTLAGVNSAEDLIGGERDIARADVSQHVIAVAPEGRYKAKMDLYQGMAVEGTQIGAGQTVMVTAVPKVAQGLGKEAGAELLGREATIIQTSWDTAVEEALLALANNAILVFNDSVGEPLSTDAYVDGEAYIYHQLIAGEDLNVSVVEVNGTPVRLVSRLVPEGEQVTETTTQAVEESGNLETSETVDESGVIEATAVVKEGVYSAAIEVLDRFLAQLKECER